MVPIVIRMDGEGKFSANYLEVWHEDENLVGLKKKLDELVFARPAPTYSRYIVIEACDLREKSQRYYGRTGTEERHRVDLHWSWYVVDLTEPIENEQYGERDGFTIGGRATYRLSRAVEMREDGTVVEFDPEDRQQRHEKWDDHEGERTVLIPFTPERYRTLVAFRCWWLGLGAKFNAFLLSMVKSVPELLNWYQAEYKQKVGEVVQLSTDDLNNLAGRIGQPKVRQKRTED